MIIKKNNTLSKLIIYVIKRYIKDDVKSLKNNSNLEECIIKEYHLYELIDINLENKEKDEEDENEEDDENNNEEDDENKNEEDDENKNENKNE